MPGRGATGPGEGRLFGDRRTGHADADSLVLFQDYHDGRLTCARSLTWPSARFTHFHPSTGPNEARHLLARPEPLPIPHVIEGMLGSLVGFHVHNWVRGYSPR